MSLASMFKWPSFKRLYPETNKFMDDHADEIDAKIQAIKDFERDINPYEKNHNSFFPTSAVNKMVERTDSLAVLISDHGEQIESEDRQAFATVLKFLANKLDPQDDFDYEGASKVMEGVLRKFRG